MLGDPVGEPLLDPGAHLAMVARTGAAVVVAVGSAAVQRRAVVVGASLAGLRAAETLRRTGHDGPVSIVGAEPHPPYDRPPLSKQILTGKAGPEDVVLRVDADLDATWLLGVAATGLDLERKRVRLGPKSKGEDDDLPFDLLVIATGAEPRVLPGAERAPGVHYLRTVDDAVALRDDLAEAERVVVIGAGFIGLEVAASARQRGLEVTVIEVLPVPLERAVGAEMGAAIAATHGRHGVDVLLGTAFDGLVGTSRVEGVRLAGGGLVPADLVVVGIGVAPATAWLAGSGVEVDDGVLCDSRLRVRAGGQWRPDIVAAGDVARWFHPGYGETVRIEHWTNAVDQGEAAARTLLEGEAAPVFAPTPYFWSDQFGTKLQFVGETRPGDTVTVVEGDPAEDRFLAAYGRGGRLVAALGMRRPARVMALQQLIASGARFPPPGA
jgi:NADPH-dependent 2,4-dienoyl-CoA reductase/sulfur reductase-like enzyme